MIDTTDSLINPALLPVIRKIKTDTSLPTFALLPREKNDFLDSGFPVDDFAIEPWDAIEIALRTKRILQPKKIISPTGQSLKHADLIIYLDKCQVMLDNKQIILTFKEYQLLKFFMSNKGKVFSREVLLEKVWGWDYYGGDRTVDVHIRRLRRKIEDKNHTFIETFRGMGYKFKDSG
jgi:DNA-binding response OmpR family regulator